MERLHVVIVPSWWPSPEDPLAGIFCHEYARAFAAAGARVGVIFPDLVSLRRMRGGVRIPRIPQVTHEHLDSMPVVRIRGLHTALGRPSLHMWRFRRWLIRGLKEYESRHGRPDNLHAMCFVPAGWACTHLAGPLAGRVVITEHTGPFSLAMHPPAQATYVRAAAERAAGVVAVSSLLREQMQAEGLGRKIAVCGNPVSSLFQLGRTAKTDSMRRPRLLFAGRLAEEKGLRELAEAARLLARENVTAEWQFVGDGPLRVWLQEQYSERGLPAPVQFHGPCPPERVAELMQQANALVLPSHGETFGLVVAEALCSGLPVVVTRGTACAEFVTEGDGELVEMHDAASLAAGIRRLLARPTDFNRQEIAERAGERFSAAAVAMWYAHLFEDVMRQDSVRRE